MRPQAARSNPFPPHAVPGQSRTGFAYAPAVPAHQFPVMAYTVKTQPSPLMHQREVPFPVRKQIQQGKQIHLSRPGGKNSHAPEIPLPAPEPTHGGRWNRDMASRAAASNPPTLSRIMRRTSRLAAAGPLTVPDWDAFPSIPTNFLEIRLLRGVARMPHPPAGTARPRPPFTISCQPFHQFRGEALSPEVFPACRNPASAHSQTLPQ